MGAGNKVAGVQAWPLWPLIRLSEARGQLFAWVPVLIGCGIAMWFSLTWEPGAVFYSCAVGLLLAAIAGGIWGGHLARPLCVALGCVMVAVLACGLRLMLVQAPMLNAPYRGPVQGRVVEIDRSQSDALRLTLDQVVLSDMAPEMTPQIVRISVRGSEPVVAPGEVVLLTADLSAPAGPAEPGGFDFRRMAFFDGMGATGYTSSPVVLWSEPTGTEQAINRLRSFLGRAIMARAPGDGGAFAAGAITGDRSGISRQVVEDLRDSSLSHLLAISGMNMALLTGFVFMLVRYGLALLPALALRISSKKLAAVFSFAVALFYLLLSGSNVATERAFLMVTVSLGAVLSDRRALTLRTLALSATVLLLWQPESLLEPGFQLSFAATAALIAGFGALDRGVMREKVPRWLIPAYTLVLSSVVAGVATAPFAAAHFNRFADLGLLANLLTVPMMSVVMAAGAVAALLGPLGLAGPAIWVMDMASRWILFVAHWISGLDGAVTAVPTPGPWVLPLITLGGLWAMLARGRMQWAGGLPILLACGLWAGATRPDLLISGDGRLAGLITPQGRGLSKAKGGGFAAQSWLENDGDLADQATAAARGGFDGPKGARSFVFGGLQGILLTGAQATTDLPGACATFPLVILSVPAPLGSAGPCHLIDQTDLDLTGTLAGWIGPDHLTLYPARAARRAWDPAPILPPIILKRP
jgi:competence protein ComEC